LARHLQEIYQTVRVRLRGQRLRLANHQAYVRVAAGVLALAITGGAMAWMMLRVLRGACTLGELALFYQAFHRGQSLMRTLLSSVGQLYSHALFLSNLFEFLGVQPAVTDPASTVPAPAGLRSGLRIRQVTFRYPGAEAAVLENFDLAVPRGATVAILGVNGAGKSTLVKLLCRLYDPEEGSIEWDGVDVRRFSLAGYRRLLTVIFQLPVAYHATAAQNIAFSDLEIGADMIRMQLAARIAGADETIGQLPHGYDTLLGNWFVSGKELSAGQWQRLSLARAFFRRSEVILLDEPTSFLDSWAEADWINRLRDAASGRTTVIVTHRLTIAMHCDVIHVMQNGKIVESGTHGQLLAREGSYAASWTANMQPAVALTATD
jgi:ATP-binding cassette subfamily B protein